MLTRMPTFSSHDGTKLAYEQDGDGFPVLLLHGFASHSYFNWVRPGIVDKLSARGYRPVTLDARGHGASDKPHDPAAYGNDNMAADASSLLDHLGIEACHFAGFSMGGRLGLSLLVREPRIRSAVLGAIGAHTLGLTGRDHDAVTEALVAADKNQIADPVARSFRDFADATRADREALAALRRAERTGPPSGLGEVHVPVLLLCARDDPIAGPPEPVASLIPGAQMVTVEGTHLNVVNNPEFQEALVGFFESADASSR